MLFLWQEFVPGMKQMQHVVGVIISTAEYHCRCVSRRQVARQKPIATCSFDVAEVVWVAAGRTVVMVRAELVGRSNRRFYVDQVTLAS